MRAWVCWGQVRDCPQARSPASSPSPRSSEGAALASPAWDGAGRSLAACGRPGVLVFKASAHSCGGMHLRACAGTPGPWGHGVAGLGTAKCTLACGLLGSGGYPLCAGYHILCIPLRLPWKVGRLVMLWTGADRVQRGRVTCGRSHSHLASSELWRPNLGLVGCGSQTTSGPLRWE